MIPVLIAAGIGVLFLAGWWYVPKKTLTAIMGTITASLVALYEGVQEISQLISQAIPPDYAPWFVVGLIGLTVAARFRK